MAAAMHSSYPDASGLRLEGRSQALGALGVFALVVVEAVVIVVRRAAVLGHIEARLLLLGRDAQHPKELEAVKERNHVGGDPAKDNEEADDLRVAGKGDAR